MNENERPTKKAEEAAPEERGEDFFSNEEHDGWSAIVKRRPSEPGIPITEITPPDPEP